MTHHNQAIAGRFFIGIVPHLLPHSSPIIGMVNASSCPLNLKADASLSRQNIELSERLTHNNSCYFDMMSHQYYENFSSITPNMGITISYFQILVNFSNLAKH